MERMFKIFEISATIIEVGILLEFINKLLVSKYDGKKGILQFLGAFTAISLYMIVAENLVSNSSAAYNIGGILIYVIYAVLLTKSDLVYRIIIPILSIMIVFFINIFTSIIATYIFSVNPDELLEEQNTLRIAMLFITKLLLFFLTRIILKKVKPKDAILNFQEMVAVSVVFIVSIIILSFSGELYYSIGNNNILNKFMLILLLGFVIISITVYILFSYIAKKNREKIKFTIMEMQYEEQKKSCEAIQTIYHDLQIIQHDIKNELLCLYNLIDTSKTEEAKQYITGLSNNKLNNFHEYVATGNEMIDALINVKLNYAREHDIDVSCSINADFHDFNSDDLICLFANAIDNAIESCIQQENGRINININSKRNYLNMSVSNTVNSSVLRHNSRLITTKKDLKKHGLGTQSMKKIAEKYDGMIEFYEKNGQFIVNIMVRPDSKK